MLVKGGLMIKSPRESHKKIETLRDSGARFRATFENAAVGIARVAPDGCWLEVNQRLCDIVGYTRKELMTKKVGDITHPDDLESDWNQARRLLAGEIENYSMEKRYYRKDGSIVWANLTVSLARKADGSPDYFVSVIEDISARKRLEEANMKRVALLADVRDALAEHQAPMQSMLQKSAEALVRHLDAAFARIWTLNPKESLLELQASAGMYTHLNGGHSRVPFGKLKIGLIAQERQPHLTNDVCNDPRVSDKKWAREEGMVAFAGYPLLVEDRVVGVMAMFARHPLTEDTVEAIATVAAPIAQGIERKRAEEALRASEEQFRILADTAPVMIWVSGTDKLCTFFNKTWLDFTGRAMEEELGAGWTEGVHQDDYDRCLETYVTSFEAREPFKMEYRLRRHDGERRWILDHGIPRFSHGGDFLGYIGTCVDITERKQAEAEREQLAHEQVARAAAEAANRSKDEFLAMVSHELRSPLNAILGYTRMLRYGPMDREAINNVTAIVERSAKAQLQIIEDLFDSARIITGKLRIDSAPVDLAPVLEAALDTVRSAAEAKGVTLVADFGASPEQVFGDPTRLQQVVWNLLTNAVKFTPEGGRVELRMEGAGDSVRITVSDTGRGIEPEFLPFVFDPLRQADSSSSRRYGGLGLGLSLVKHLVELHGGTITAASEGARRGSTFTVTLPRRQFEFIAAQTPAVAPHEAHMEVAATMDRDLSLEGVSVLVVDDQEDARELLMHALSEYGAEVTTASSGVEALAFLSDPPEGKRPDALIMDIAMPDEDGYTVLKKVRALEAAQVGAADRIPAIALTAYGRTEDRLRALQAGFQMHVNKPVDPAELVVIIASLTTRRAWQSRREE